MNAIIPTDEIHTYAQNEMDEYCTSFAPGLKVIVEFADLPLNVLGFAYLEGKMACRVVLDKLFCLICANRSYFEGIDDSCLHEFSHCVCLIQGNTSRHDCGFHGSQYAGQCRKIGAALGFPHPVYSHNSRRKRRRKYVHDCKFWPMNQRPDLARYTEICEARRAALLRPVASGQAAARVWSLKDTEGTLEALHTLVDTVNAIEPRPTRERLAGIIAARQAVESIAGRLAACGLLPAIPVSSWDIVKSVKAEPDPVKEAIAALIESVERGTNE